MDDLYQREGTGDPFVRFMVVEHGICHKGFEVPSPEQPGPYFAMIGAKFVFQGQKSVRILSRIRKELAIFFLEIDPQDQLSNVMEKAAQKGLIGLFEMGFFCDKPGKSRTLERMPPISTVENPAWDFRRVWKDVEVGTPVGFRGRIEYFEFQSEEEIVERYRVFWEEGGEGGWHFKR